MKRRFSKKQNIAFLHEVDVGAWPLGGEPSPLTQSKCGGALEM